MGSAEEEVPETPAEETNEIAVQYNSEDVINQDREGEEDEENSEDLESGEGFESVEVITDMKKSDESFLRRNVESPMDLKRIKWQEADLLFLKTEYSGPYQYFVHEAPAKSFQSGLVLLDFEFIQGSISKNKYDYFLEKYRLFVKAYERKHEYLKELTNDNLIYKATLRDHQMIEEWFESMPENIDSKQEANKSGGKQQLRDIRKERLNAIAYKLILNALTEKENQWTTQLNRAIADKNFLDEEIRRNSPEDDMTGKKQVIGNLLSSIYALEDNLNEVIAKLKLTEDFSQGFITRNEVLESKLANVEMQFADDNKDLKNLKMETENIQKSVTESMEVLMELNKNLEEAEEQKRSFTKQFQKLQYESNRENQKMKKLTKHAEAMKTEKHLWDVRLTRIKEKMEAMGEKKIELEQVMEATKHEKKIAEKNLNREQASLEKLENKLKNVKKAIETLKTENEVYKTKINTQKDNLKRQYNPSKLANERKKIEKEIDKLQSEFIVQSRLQGNVRQDYVRLHGEVKKLQQNQWALRKLFQDNIGKIRKARLEQSHQLENNQKLTVEIENQKNQIRWVKQQKIADEKLLDKKDAELRKQLAAYRAVRLEKAKDLQEMNLKLESINQWKEVNRVSEAEHEELQSLKVQLQAKREDMRKKVDEVQDFIKSDAEKSKDNRADLTKARIECEARLIGMHKMRFTLYKKQLENERFIQVYTEAAVDRNHKSMKLNDLLREHVCYTEHISTTEEMIKRADNEYLARMDAITRLESIKKMEMLGMDRMRQKLESFQGSLDYLEDLARRFEEVTSRQIEMQKMFQGTRYRIVRDSQKENPKKVEEKLEQLQERVQLREEKVLELKLLNYQTEKLLADLQKNKEEKSQLVMSMSAATIDLERKNIRANGKAKQILVELALKKATLDTVKKQLDESKRIYQEAEEKLKRGEAPTRKIENEWLRMTKKIGNSYKKRERAQKLKTGQFLQVVTLEC